MLYARPITELVSQRYSCRTFLETAIEETTQRQLAEFLSALRAGPLGSAARFELVAATEQDRHALKGLGT